MTTGIELYKFITVAHPSKTATNREIIVPSTTDRLRSNLCKSYTMVNRHKLYIEYLRIAFRNCGNIITHPQLFVNTFLTLRAFYLQVVDYQHHKNWSE